MNSSNDKIMFEVDISKMIELLAAQIYPSPFALLRENIQNAFDAILLRQFGGDKFSPLIEVTITPHEVQVADNGVGMSVAELKGNFWKAGSSSKNTEEAQRAGVVGTFGIGAMANFGIATRLVVETESRKTGERTRCSAEKEKLSVTEECIDFVALAKTGEPGSRVVASIREDDPIDVDAARKYVREFVRYLKFPVRVNGEIESQNDIGGAVAGFAQSWKNKGTAAVIGRNLIADFALEVAGSGEVRLDLTNLVYKGELVPGRVVLREGAGSLMTYRNSFGLAAAGLGSRYNFGGVVDFMFLKPTAGREALTADSLTRLQRILSPLDEFVSLQLAARPEANQNNNFVAWVHTNKRYDLCDHLRVRLEPGDSATLAELKVRSQRVPLLVYAGNDGSIIKLGSEERPLVVLSRQTYRRECEHKYLTKYCKIEEVTNEPRVISTTPEQEFKMAESAIAFRLSSILANDYFVTADIKLGEISHGLPVLVIDKRKPVQVVLQRTGASLETMAHVYNKEYSAFDHLVKDFARNIIFPRISHLVPSATRQGAEAFLKLIQRNREVFEYEYEDLESLTKVWQDYLKGRITQPQAASRANAVARRSHQFIDRGAAGAVRDIVPDVIEGERAAPPEDLALAAQPPIERLDIETAKKILTIESSEPALRGYRCFLALTDRAREERGEFFLQPHRTSVVWGGQKALFIFEHHSGEFGFYYDIQAVAPLSTTSGGGATESCTIVMKNKIFVPVPPAIQDNFLPAAEERKRLDIRFELLHIDRLEEAPV